jgi:phosphoglycerate dehydrogenase-like enzyme
VIPPELEFVSCTATDEETLAEACVDADAILGSFTMITERVIDRANRLKLIQMPMAGYDSADIEAAARRGIPVATSAGANATTVSEYVMFVAMMFYRRIVEGDEAVKTGKYAETRAGLNSRMYEMRGKTMGIVGLGRIGRNVAKRARAFDMRVLYYDIVRPTPDEEKQMGVQFAPFEEILSSSDIVTIHVPLTSETRGMIGADQLRMLKPTAVFVNAARGPIVDELALIDAVEKGQFIGAAVDVYSVEPLPADHPYHSMSEAGKNRIMLTPHIAGGSKESHLRMSQMALDNLARVARGEKPIDVVNGIA